MPPPLPRPRSFACESTAPSSQRRNSGRVMGVEVAFGAGLPAAVLTEGIRIIEITPGREASAPVLARYPLIVGATGEAGGLALLGAEFEEFRRAFFDVLAEPPIPASERSVIVAEAGALMERMLGAMQSRVEAEFAALSRRIEALEEGRPPPPGRSAIRRTD